MTTPPTAYTAELEAMISIMSGDATSALVWLQRLSPEQLDQFKIQLGDLSLLVDHTRESYRP